jgi:hypothetical protein
MDKTETSCSCQCERKRTPEEDAKAARQAATIAIIIAWVALIIVTSGD